MKLGQILTEQQMSDYQNFFEEKSEKSQQMTCTMAKVVAAGEECVHSNECHWTKERNGVEEYCEE